MHAYKLLKEKRKLSEEAAQDKRQEARGKTI